MCAAVWCVSIMFDTSDTCWTGSTSGFATLDTVLEVFRDPALFILLSTAILAVSTADTSNARNNFRNSYYEVQHETHVRQC